MAYNIGEELPQEGEAQLTEDGEIIPPKRRRGRPRKDESSPPIGDANQASKPRRGRKGKTEQIEELANSIQGLHELTYIMTSLEAVRIDQIRAKMLAEPAYEVIKKYHLDMVSEYAPEIALAAAMALVYGPMIHELRSELARKRSEAARDVTPPEEQPSNVTPITTYGPQFPG